MQYFRLRGNDGYSESSSIRYRYQKQFINQLLMRTLIVILALSFSTALGARSYDSLDTDFSEIVEMMNTGGKAPRVKALSSILEGYDKHLADEFEPFFREVMAESADAGRRLLEVENIPVLRTLIEGCIRAASTRLKGVQGKTLGTKDIEAYATTVTCVGYIRRLIDRLDYFLQGNRSYLFANGYKDRFYALHAKARSTETNILEESGLYLRFLIR